MTTSPYGDGPVPPNTPGVPASPGGVPPTPHEAASGGPQPDTSQPVDLSRYRRGGAAPPPAPRPTRQRTGWTTELTTSLSGWIMGARGRGPREEPETSRSRRATVYGLIIVCAIMILFGLIAATLVSDWLGPGE